MIPPFDESGFLQAGIHTASLKEFEDRFSIFNRSDRRIKLYDGIRRLCEAMSKVSFVKQVLVAGSYVSSKAEPNDFDCLLVIDRKLVPQTVRPFEYQALSRRAASKQFGGDVIVVAEGSKLHHHYLQFFQRTRDRRTIGIVEIRP